MLTVSLMALSMAASGFALTGQQEVLEQPAPAANGAQWQIISRSSTTVYMIDVNAITQQDGITAARLARVPATGDASDQTHSVSELSFRCAAKQSKSGEEIYYAADGSIEETIPNDYDFEPIPPNSLDDFAKAIVCDGDRASRSFPTIAAFIAAGRPARN